MSAWFKGKLAHFVDLNREDIVRRLATKSGDKNFELLASQIDSRRNTIDGLIQ